MDRRDTVGVAVGCVLHVGGEERGGARVTHVLVGAAFALRQGLAVVVLEGFVGREAGSEVRKLRRHIPRALLLRRFLPPCRTLVIRYRSPLLLRHIRLRVLLMTRRIVIVITRRGTRCVLLSL